MGAAASSVIVPAVMGFATVLTQGIVQLFTGTPKTHNDTLKQIEAHNLQQTEQAEREQREAEAERHRRESEAKLQKQRREAEAQRKKQEETLQQAKAAESRAAEALAQLQAQEEAARRSATEAKAREEKLLKEKEELEALHLSGIKPVVMPTLQQVLAAKESLQFLPSKLHFATCGPSGSGKSSLINALRGLSASSPYAAKTGTVETTASITRYPDPRENFPYKRFVWYDIPGAGTLKVPDWMYFNDHGLFVFDFIILVYGGRFTAIDAGILENCQRFRIPNFLVRSKSDQEIRNMMDDYDGDEDDAEVYEMMKKKFVEDTRADVKRNLRMLEEERGEEMRGLSEKKVYIVNHHVLRELLSTEEPGKRRRRGGGKMIDEVALVEKMLRVGAMRRYGREVGVMEKARELAGRAGDGLVDALETLRVGVGLDGVEEKLADGFVKV